MTGVDSQACSMLCEVCLASVGASTFTIFTCTYFRYIPWNVHVPAEDTYSFEGIAVLQF